MDASLIAPFVESIHDFFSMMLDSEVQRKSLAFRERTSASAKDIVASIDLNGWLRGTIDLLLPEETAIAVFNRLTGLQSDTVDDSVLDGVAESVNIIAGSAKSKLAHGERPPLDLGIPSVSHGRSPGNPSVPEEKSIEVSFTSGLGPLVLRVTLESCP